MTERTFFFFKFFLIFITKANKSVQKTSLAIVLQLAEMVIKGIASKKLNLFFYFSRVIDKPTQIKMKYFVGFL